MSRRSAGYETVEEGEKVERVREVFSRTAPSYDIMNDLMSVGIHHLWKDRSVGRPQNIRV